MGLVLTDSMSIQKEPINGKKEWTVEVLDAYQQIIESVLESDTNSGEIRIKATPECLEIIYTPTEWIAAYKGNR